MLIEVILVIFIYFLLFFLLGTAIKNNSIVDMAWGIGFVIIAIYSLVRTGNYGVVSLVTTLLVTLWGGRLFYHIMKRNLGKPEDFRYANWRKEWGKYVVIRAFFQVYMLQGVFMFIIAFPVVLIHEMAGVALNAMTVLGIAVWCFGYYFEVVGDAQLAAFKKNPENKGKLMTTGLWAYTRHPNYFGEATMWWGIFIIALSSGVTWLAVLSPVVITYLLVFVSGVPMLEKAMVSRPGFDTYSKRTNKFLPWFPKK